MSINITDYQHLPLDKMEEIVAYFEDRVRAAQASAPATVDWVKNAIRRENPAKCPMWLRRATPDVIIKYGDAFADLLCEFPDPIARVAPYDIMVGYKPKVSVSSVEALMKNTEWVNEWGVGWKHIVGGVGAMEYSHPLKEWGDLDEYLATTFPDPDAPGRLDGAIAPVSALKAAGTYSFGLFGAALYHVFSIRGMENAMMDFYTNPDEMHRLIDALTDYAVRITRHWSKIGVDAILFSDDWGTQNAMLINPTIWREFFKPAYKRFFDEVHAHRMDVIMHSCGNITEIVEDLIEIGLDVLDPIQTGAMDVNEVAERFGGRLTFCGLIDVQNLLPTGTPGQIKDTIHRNIELLGSPFGNGLILSPTNTITPDVPLENIRAMFEACHGQG